MYTHISYCSLQFILGVLLFLFLFLVALDLVITKFCGHELEFHTYTTCAKLVHGFEFQILLILIKRDDFLTQQIGNFVACQAKIILRVHCSSDNTHTHTHARAEKKTPSMETTHKCRPLTRPSEMGQVERLFHFGSILVSSIDLPVTLLKLRIILHLLTYGFKNLESVRCHTIE